MAAIDTSENNFLYRCLKKSDEPRKMDQLCQWNGSVFDYAAHVREIHPLSCFKCRKNTAFHWKLPPDDCYDKGLVQFKSSDYLYEIWYQKNGDSQEAVFVALTNPRADVQNYELRLCHKILADFYVAQEMNPLHSLLVPLHQKQHIKVTKSVLSDYCGPSGRLKFKFVFNKQ